MRKISLLTIEKIKKDFSETLISKFDIQSAELFGFDIDLLFKIKFCKQALFEEFSLGFNEDDTIEAMMQIFNYKITICDLKIEEAVTDKSFDLSLKDLSYYKFDDLSFIRRIFIKEYNSEGVH